MAKVIRRYEVQVQTKSFHWEGVHSLLASRKKAEELLRQCVAQFPEQTFRGARIVFTEEEWLEHLDFINLLDQLNHLGEIQG